MAVMYKITQGKIPKLPDYFSPGVHNIYERLVQRNQKKRYSAAQVLKDDFISSHLQKMKKRVSDEWVHSIEIAKNILDQEPPSHDAPATTAPGQQQAQILSKEGFILSEELHDYHGGDDTLAPGGDHAATVGSASETVVNRGGSKQEGGVEIKTAAELAAERKKQKQLEEERLIREATKNTWLENYKHRDNVKRLYHSQDAASSIAMQPHSRGKNSVYPNRNPATLPEQSRGTVNKSQVMAGTVAAGGAYTGPVMPKPTRIASPDSLAMKRVGTTQGERKPNNLKASFSSSSPEEKDRNKRQEQDEDSGFSSVSASNESNNSAAGGAQLQHQDTWNSRPISAKNRMFEEILEEELRKSGEMVAGEGGVNNAAGGGYTPSGVIPRKPFVPLKKGTGKMAYNSNKPKNTRKRKGKKKRARDHADGEEGEEGGEDELDSEGNVEDAYDGEADTDDVGGGGALNRRGGTVNPENRPLVFVDAYSPSVKARKIANMRSECKKKMGEKNFDKVYKYLQNARQKSSSNESKIFEELSRLHSVSDDNFLVDQLIFLELTSA